MSKELQFCEEVHFQLACLGRSTRDSKLKTAIVWKLIDVSEKYQQTVDRSQSDMAVDVETESADICSDGLDGNHSPKVADAPVQDSYTAVISVLLAVETTLQDDSNPILWCSTMLLLLVLAKRSDFGVSLNFFALFCRRSLEISCESKTFPAGLSAGDPPITSAHSSIHRKRKFRRSQESCSNVTSPCANKDVSTAAGDLLQRINSEFSGLLKNFCDISSDRDLLEAQRTLIFLVVVRLLSHAVSAKNSNNDSGSIASQNTSQGNNYSFATLQEMQQLLHAKSSVDDWSVLKLACVLIAKTSGNIYQNLESCAIVDSSHQHIYLCRLWLLLELTELTSMENTIVQV